MDIRQAILMAADHIEASPHEFRFVSRKKPEFPGCGTPGCALGWISCFAEIDGLRFRSALPLLGLPETHNGEQSFYDRMRAIGNGEPWINSPAACARRLRTYADHYHPAPAQPEPKGIPSSVRRIFEPECA